MKTVIEEFTYYFSLHGSRGGLYSLKCGFRLHPGTGEGGEEMKEAIRGLVAAHAGPLDRVFDTVVVGERQPILTDSPYAVSTGYRYEGRIRKRGGKRIAARLAEMFGESAIDGRGGTPFIESLVQNMEASIECKARRDGAALRDATVDVEYRMNHMLNVCFFHFVRSLDGVEASEKARQNLEALDNLLATGWEREGRDHYRAMIAGGRGGADG